MADIIISKKDAKSQGLKFYFTGKPCINGHVTKRYIGNSTCVLCNNSVAKVDAVYICPSCGHNRLIKSGERNRCNKCDTRNTRNWQKNNPEATKEIAKRRQARDWFNPEKRAMHFIRTETRKAVVRGILVAQPCEKCGDPKVDAHHDDYNRPLDVRWLCRAHHAEWHNGNKPIKLREIKQLTRSDIYE